MAVWPVSLPSTMEVGANEEFVQGFIRSPVDKGPSKSRRRFTNSPRVLNGTMLFDATQRAAFDTFYKTTISEGADEFDFTDPVDLSTVTARFVEAPKFSMLAGSASGVALYRVSLSIEIIV